MGATLSQSIRSIGEQIGTVVMKVRKIMAVQKLKQVQPKSRLDRIGCHCCAIALLCGLGYQARGEFRLYSFRDNIRLKKIISFIIIIRIVYLPHDTQTYKGGKK